MDPVGPCCALAVVQLVLKQHRAPLSFSAPSSCFVPLATSDVHVYMFLGQVQMLLACIACYQGRIMFELTGLYISLLCGLLD